MSPSLSPYSDATLNTLVKCLYARCHNNASQALACIIQTELDLIGHDLYQRGQTYDAFYIMCHQSDLLVRNSIDDLALMLEDIICNTTLPYDTRRKMLQEIANHGRHSFNAFGSRLIDIEMSDSLFRYACLLKDEGDMVDILKLVFAFGFIFVSTKLQRAVYDQNSLLVRLILDHIVMEHEENISAQGFLRPIEDGLYGGIKQVYDVVSMYVSTMGSCGLRNDKFVFYEWAQAIMYDTMRDMDAFSARCEKEIKDSACYEWTEDDYF